MIRRAGAAVLGVVLCLGGAWGVGFTRFTSEALTKPSPPPRADGIVVLTGGADRVETGLRLLTDGYAPRLLVSGVGRGGELPELAKRAQIDPADVADRVTIGHEATTTIGNAAEIAAWARPLGIHRLIVVTAGYHMARALLEIGRDLPGVTLVSYPVQPPALRGRLDLATTRLLASEYNKLLAVRSGFNVLMRKGART